MSAPHSLTVRFWRIVFASYGYDEVAALKQLAADAAALTGKGDRA